MPKPPKHSLPDLPALTEKEYQLAIKGYKLVGGEFTVKGAKNTVRLMKKEGAYSNPKALLSDRTFYAQKWHIWGKPLSKAKNLLELMNPFRAEAKK